MQQWYQCPRCSAPVAFGSRFCTNCGMQLDWQMQRQAQLLPVHQQPQQQWNYSYSQTREEHKKARVNKWQRLAKTFPIAMAIVCLLLLAIFVVSQSQMPSTEPSVTEPPASDLIQPSSPPPISTPHVSELSSPAETEPSQPPENQYVGSINSDVQITHIFYDGLVYLIESDEYVEITNLGSEPQDLAEWVLKDISEGYPSFKFPSYILTPGAIIRVYTNEVHPETGGFSFSYSKKAIWNNKSPDTAALYNTQGQEVSRKSY